MHISLTAELESRVKAKVESGLYNNASEVIREALRFMGTKMSRFTISTLPNVVYQRD